MLTSHDVEALNAIARELAQGFGGAGMVGRDQSGALRLILVRQGRICRTCEMSSSSLETGAEEIRLAVESLRSLRPSRHV